MDSQKRRGYMIENQGTWEMVHRGLYARQYPHIVSVLKLDASVTRACIYADGTIKGLHSLHNID